jgi:G3E family GTPase
VSPTPVILVCGVADEPMSVATISLLWDLPNAVAVHHEIDVDRNLLIRTVSDVAGVVEKREIDIEHACVSCAIREDIVPTLERFGARGKWDVIVARLPLTAEAIQVCRVVGYAPERVRNIRIAACVVALTGEHVCDDLLGDDTLHDRNLGASADDDRGVGEVACAMVEYADVVAIWGEATDEARDLLRTVARPGALLVSSALEIEARVLLEGLHDHQAAEDWVAEVRRGAIVTPHGSRAWVLDFRTELPLHPERLFENIEALGGGPRRSRGCFWLPSRPDQVCAWDGAGGQLSIGSTERWGNQLPMTRIVIVGLDDGMEELKAALAACVLNERELSSRGRYWEVGDDGLETWLGPIRWAA